MLTIFGTVTKTPTTHAFFTTELYILFLKPFLLFCFASFMNIIISIPKAHQNNLSTQVYSPFPYLVCARVRFPKYSPRISKIFERTKNSETGQIEDVIIICERPLCATQRA